MCRTLFYSSLKKANLWFAFSFFWSAAALAAPAVNASIDWAHVSQLAEEKRLSQSTIWHRLGHYDCAWTGCTSQEDGDDFFLDKDGAENPEKELRATLKAFETNAPRDFKGRRPVQTPRCQFPARLTWLARETGGWDADALLQDCPEFQYHKNKLDAAGASLVFSSFYLNNPSSSFGHTLLKVKKKSGGDNSNADLLNVGVGYAANPTTKNPVLYALMGMFGGFFGSYSALPYYYKVREYNDFENRDLWEYELDLTPSEVDMMVKHLWELGFTDFRYFYLSENCAYHLMNILDISAQRLNLSEPLPYWVLPLDTVKAVTDTPGLVKKISHRPSLASTLERRFASLDSTERNQFLQAIKTYDPASPMNYKVLDAVIDNFDIEHGQQLLKNDKETSLKKHQLLVKRASMPEMPLALSDDSAEDPRLSHKSFRWELGPGRRDNPLSGHRDVAYLGVRFSLHDLTDPVIGLPPTARLEMFYFDFFYDTKEKRLHTDRFRFVGIESLNSWSTLWKRPAWRADIGAERIQDRRCFDCTSIVTGASIGLAKTFNLGAQITPFAYANGRGRIGKFKRDDFSVEAGPSAGLRVLTKYDLNLLGEFEWRTVWAGFRQSYGVTHFSIQKSFDRKWALHAQFDQSDRTRQGRLTWMLFL